MGLVNGSPLLSVSATEVEAPPVSASETGTFVRVVLPVFWTVMVQVTVSPASARPLLFSSVRPTVSL